MSIRKCSQPRRRENKHTVFQWFSVCNLHVQRGVMQIIVHSKYFSFSTWLSDWLNDIIIKSHLGLLLSTTSKMDQKQKPCCSNFWSLGRNAMVSSVCPIYRSLPADVLWGSFVTHSFLTQRTSAGRLYLLRLTDCDLFRKNDGNTFSVATKPCGITHELESRPHVINLLFLLVYHTLICFCCCCCCCLNNLLFLV